MSENTFESLLGPNLRSVRTLVQRRVGTSNQAEDIVQEILQRAFQRRNQLRVHTKFRAWLWSIALNEIRRSTVAVAALSP
jgi:DNA-directed RNA polymerase specialized sigma24 family protein